MAWENKRKLEVVNQKSEIRNQKSKIRIRIFNPNVITMELKEQFEAAQLNVKKLTERPGNEELLDLYALFKQATEGDNNSKKPGMFDMKGQFKWKQWKSKEGLTSDQAMQTYVDLVNSLLEKYPHS